MFTLIALSTLLAPASAFGRQPSTSQHPADRTPFLVVNPPGTTPRETVNQALTTTSLSAVIYGWDGEEDTTETMDIFNDYSERPCGSDAASSVAAAAVAQKLSYEADNVGSLARLAVAFSPPERALTLKDVENVHVLCVGEDRIEIEAVICEDGGCVSLAVPVTFPKKCSAEWLEGCVMRNLDELDVEAESILRVKEGTNSDNDAEGMRGELVYPTWWVRPEYDSTLVAECNTICGLLNEAEFQADIQALARRGLQSLHDGYAYEVMRAVVEAVGPAGICLKVRAAFTNEEHNPVHILDVTVPFGGGPVQDAASLRAAVLGTVAAGH